MPVFPSRSSKTERMAKRVYLTQGQAHSNVFDYIESLLQPGAPAFDARLSQSHTVRTSSRGMDRYQRNRQQPSIPAGTPLDASRHGQRRSHRSPRGWRHVHLGHTPRCRPWWSCPRRGRASSPASHRHAAPAPRARMPGVRRTAAAGWRSQRRTMLSRSNAACACPSGR